MLKKYEYHGRLFLFEEGEQPEGAKLVEKAKKPANKARKATTRARKTESKEG